MSAPGPILRECHRLLKHAHDLQTRITQAPRALAAQQTRARKMDELLHAAQDALKKLKVATHEKEVEIKTKRQQIDKYQKQLNDIKNAKEFDALKHEIAAAQQLVSQLEDEVLAALDEIDRQAAALPEAEKEVKRAHAELADFDRISAARVAEFAAQRQQALTELVQVEATLPDDVKALYERPVKAKGEDALSAVENRTCVACYTEVTAQNFNELLSGRYVTCKSCGRILYLVQ